MCRSVGALVVAVLGLAGCISIQQVACDAAPCGVEWDHGPSMRPRAPVPQQQVEVHDISEGVIPNVRRMGTFRWPLAQLAFGPTQCTSELLGFLIAKAANLGFDGLMEVHSGGGSHDGERQYAMFCIASPYVLEP